jgi:hypothetical protein
MDTAITAIHVCLVIPKEKAKTMKKVIILLSCIILNIGNLFSQEKSMVTGEVTFANFKNVYVKFESNSNLSSGDTLLILVKTEWKKALLVTTVSSKSILTTNFTQEKVIIGTKVGYNLKDVKEKPLIKDQDKIISKDLVEAEKPKAVVLPTTQTYNGRITVSTNGSMEKSENNFNRIRTSMNFDVKNIKGGKFSFENYINYNRRFGVADSLQNFKEDFKVYSLSTTYEHTNKTSFSFGRKMNFRIANMGAIDGLQVEHRYKSILMGGFGGTRPDVLNYGLNMSLMQFGAYLAKEKEKGRGMLQTSLAFAEQQNHGKTDRRFVYFQHSNSVLGNFSLFYSIELDLYQNIDSVKFNGVNLTSTYLSLRYKPTKKLSISTSYDNRRNVIYYETYRSYLDQILNQETRQGIRLQMNYNPSKYVSFNISGFYRYQESKPQPTKNYVANVFFSQIPGLKSSFNLNFNNMKTYYFSGNIIGARLNKDLFKGKVYTEFSYRKVDYDFFSAEQPNLKQDVLGVSLNVYGKKRSSIMLNYEGTFEPNTSYNRYYITLSQRFKSKN